MNTRRFLPGLVLFSVLLFTTGCSLISKKEEVPTPPVAEVTLQKRTGFLTTAGEQGLSREPETFVLATDSGESFVIRSISVNLKKYKGRRIEVEGTISEDGKEIDAQNVTSLTQDTVTKKQYKDSELGISFSLPAVWEVRESRNVVGVNKITIIPYEVDDDELTTVDRITVERSENNKKLSAREWLSLDELYRPLTEEKDVVYQESTIGSGQLPAVKKTYGSGSQVDFFVQRDTAIYILSHTSVDDADKDLYRNAYYDIVASFEFIPFTPQTTPKEQILPTAGTSTSTIIPVPLTPEVAPAIDERKTNATPPGVVPTNEEVNPTQEVKTGMQEVTAKAYNITFQLPKAWYWAYSTEGYKLDSKEVEDTSTEFLARFFRTREAPTTASTGLIDGNPFFETGNADKTQYCVQKGKNYYCIETSVDNKQTVKEILASLKDLP